PPPIFTVHHPRRWDPDFVAVRRTVEAGFLGSIFNVETFVGGYAHPCRTWHSDSAISGGAVYDWGSHHIDWVLQLLGESPQMVQAHGHKRVWHDVTNLDQLRVRMTWSDGREAEFFQSDIAAGRRPRSWVRATAGTLVGHSRVVPLEPVERGRGYVARQMHHAEAPAELLLARYESGYGISETRLPPAPEQPFAFHRNLADHLHMGEPLAVTPASARRVIAVLEAARRSSEEGGAPVTLAPAAWPARPSPTTPWPCPLPPPDGGARAPHRHVAHRSPLHAPPRSPPAPLVALASERHPRRAATRRPAPRPGTRRTTRPWRMPRWRRFPSRCQTACTAGGS